MFPHTAPKALACQQTWEEIQGKKLPACIQMVDVSRTEQYTAL